MNEQDFAVLLKLKGRLDALEKRYPMSRRLKLLHVDAQGALRKLRGALNLTDEQFIALGGGTDKPDPE